MARSAAYFLFRLLFAGQVIYVVLGKLIPHLKSLKGEWLPIMNFNNEAALLCEVYHGADIGCDSIRTLLPKVKNPQFRSDLKTQYQQYQDIQSQAEEQLKTLGECPQEASLPGKMAIMASIHLNTLANRETSHLANMMIQGSTMGITEMTKTLNHYGSGDSKERSLAETLVRTEQEAIDRMKKYLS